MLRTLSPYEFTFVSLDHLLVENQELFNVCFGYYFLKPKVVLVSPNLKMFFVAGLGLCILLRMHTIN